MRNLYHKIRFYIKSFIFPKTLLVGNTQNRLLVHNWQTSMDIFNGSTIVKDGKMFYEPEEYWQFVEIAKNKKCFLMLALISGGIVLWQTGWAWKNLTRLK